MSYLWLFLTFCKFSLLSFGGGYMLIPLLLESFVGEGQILTGDTFGNLVSISQVTPGPVGINCATYVGFVNGGFWGALLATVGLVAPTFVLGITLLKLLKRYRNTKIVQGLLYGVHLAAAGLIGYAAVIFFELAISGPIPFAYWGRKLCGLSAEFPAATHWSWAGFLLALLSVVLLLKTRQSVTRIILLGATLGALLVTFWHF